MVVEGLPVQTSCRVLGISVSGFYPRRGQLLGTTYQWVAFPTCGLGRGNPGVLALVDVAASSSHGLALKSAWLCRDPGRSRKVWPMADCFVIVPISVPQGSEGLDDDDVATNKLWQAFSFTARAVPVPAKSDSDKVDFIIQKLDVLQERHGSSPDELVRLVRLARHPAATDSDLENLLKYVDSREDAARWRHGTSPGGWQLGPRKLKSSEAE